MGGLGAPAPDLQVQGNGSHMGIEILRRHKTLPQGLDLGPRAQAAAQKQPETPPQTAVHQAPHGDKGHVIAAVALLVMQAAPEADLEGARQAPQGLISVHAALDQGCGKAGVEGLPRQQARTRRQRHGRGRLTAGSGHAKTGLGRGPQESRRILQRHVVKIEVLAGGQVESSAGGEAFSQLGGESQLLRADTAQSDLQANLHPARAGGGRLPTP